MAQSYSTVPTAVLCHIRLCQAVLAMVWIEKIDVMPMAAAPLQEQMSGLQLQQQPNEPKQSYAFWETQPVAQFKEDLTSSAAAQVCLVSSTAIPPIDISVCFC